VFFKVSRNGKLTKLLEYNKNDYTDYGHFLANISRFFPANFFLQKPIPCETVSIAELDRIFEEISD